MTRIPNWTYRTTLVKVGNIVFAKKIASSGVVGIIPKKYEETVCKAVSLYGAGCHDSADAVLEKMLDNLVKNGHATRV